jgi:hypothetical protein
MTILVYHGKHGDEYYRVDTPERIDAALRQLFTQLDEDGCYEDEDVSKARAGDIGAIRQLLGSRQDCEYESWDIEEAIDPL